MKIHELFNESAGYWNYTFSDRSMTIYYNPELTRSKRWNWRDNQDIHSFGEGFFTKRLALDSAKIYAEGKLNERNQVDLQSIPR